MASMQEWQSEVYKGVEVHACALPAEGREALWSYAVRIADQGEDASAESALLAQSGGDALYSSQKEAVQAAFTKGYGMVDALSR